MVPGLSMTFLILPKELLISIMYMGAKVIACSGIYGDGVKVRAVANIPH
jgi:hypothetical protein